MSILRNMFFSEIKMRMNKSGILWIPIWILKKKERTIKNQKNKQGTLLSDTGFNWDQNWVLLLPTVLLSMSIFSFQTRFLSIFGAKKWHGSSHLMRKKKISQALPSGPCSLAYTKMILALWPLKTTKESRSCIIWFPLPNMISSNMVFTNVVSTYIFSTYLVATNMASANVVSTNMFFN